MALCTACGSDDVQPSTGGGTGTATSTGTTSTPDSQSGPMSSSQTDGNPATTAVDSSDTGPLPECEGQAAICYEIPSARCECPEGLECVGDAIGHVRDCQPCDCPPDHTCYSDAVGGYNCWPDPTGTTDESSTGGSGTGSTG